MKSIRVMYDWRTRRVLTILPNKRRRCDGNLFDVIAVNADECLMTRMQEMSLDYHFTVEQEVGSATYAFFGFNGKPYSQKELKVLVLNPIVWHYRIWCRDSWCMENFSTQWGWRMEGPHHSGGYGFGSPSKPERLEICICWWHQGINNISMQNQQN